MLPIAATSGFGIMFVVSAHPPCDASRQHQLLPRCTELVRAAHRSDLDDRDVDLLLEKDMEGHQGKEPEVSWPSIALWLKGSIGRHQAVPELEEVPASGRVSTIAYHKQKWICSLCEKLLRDRLSIDGYPFSIIDEMGTRVSPHLGIRCNTSQE